MTKHDILQLHTQCALFVAADYGGTSTPLAHTLVPRSLVRSVLTLGVVCVTLSVLAVHFCNIQQVRYTLMTKPHKTEVYTESQVERRCFMSIRHVPNLPVESLINVSLLNLHMYA